MSVCTFAKEYFTSAVTNVDNGFISHYLPIATGNTVKVYLYGLSLCQSGLNFTLADFAEGVNMPEDEVIGCFRFWEDFDLVRILCEDPFAVQYLPIGREASKPRKYSPEKYTAFSKDIQVLIPNRMISTAEFTEYYNLMETFNIKPEAMLMICKYCVDLKGENISYRYISQVVKDFGIRGIVTAKLIEEELKTYYGKNDDVVKILAALGSKKKPDLEDGKLVKKWTNSLGYDADALIFAAKKCKKASMEKLDAFIEELYKNRRFSQSEISDYIAKKDELYELTVEIAKTLGVYIDVISAYADNYTAKWLSMGYESEGLKVIAEYSFKRGENSFEKMDFNLSSMAAEGVISNDSIKEYFNREHKKEEFLAKILAIAGSARKPTAWDKNNYGIWKSWNFTDEMIEKAAELAAGKSSPIPYINATLGSWKNQGVFSPEQINYSKYNIPAASPLPAKTPEEIAEEKERRRLKKNYERIYGESADFKRAEDKLPSLELELALAEFYKDEGKKQSLEKEKATLVELRLKALKEFNLTENDISNK